MMIYFCSYIGKKILGVAEDFLLYVIELFNNVTH